MRQSWDFFFERPTPPHLILHVLGTQIMPKVGTRLLEPYFWLGPELRTPTLLVLTAYHMHTCSNANITDKTCGENRCLVIHCLHVQHVKMETSGGFPLNCTNTVPRTNKALTFMCISCHCVLERCSQTTSKR